MGRDEFVSFCCSRGEVNSMKSRAKVAATMHKS